MPFEMPVPKSTGNGYPAFKFTRKGDTLKGVITSEPDVIDRPTIDNPSVTEKQLVFELHTEAPVTSVDQYGQETTGQDWAVWIRLASHQYRALHAAVKGGLAEGDTVAFRLADLLKPKQSGFSPAKVFDAAHTKGSRLPEPVAAAGSDLL